MRVGDGGGTRLGGGCCEHHAHKVRGVFDGLFLLVHAGVALGLQQFPLDALVDDKVDDSLGDAGIRGRHAPVETSQPVHLVHPPHALKSVHSPFTPVSVIMQRNAVSPSVSGNYEL